MVKNIVIELKKIQSIEKKIVVFLVKKVEMDASYWARNTSSKMSEKKIPRVTVQRAKERWVA